MERLEQLKQAAQYIREQISGDLPDTGIILGSGLGTYADSLENPVEIPYRDIPGFVTSTAPNHKGVLFAGRKGGHSLLVMSGRFHYYEGYSMKDVIFPVQVMALLGIRRLIITNASGAINPDFRPGHLMLIRDHVNMSGMNPLIGPNLDELGDRFPDMSDVYNRDLRKKMLREAQADGIELYEGVYAMMSGPSFETPAEIRFLHTIGCDAVGMSSVPEAIAAKHAGLEIIAISALANAAAGISPVPLSSSDVLEASAQIADSFRTVVDIAVNV